MHFLAKFGVFVTLLLFSIEFNRGNKEKDIKGSCLERPGCASRSTDSAQAKIFFRVYFTNRSNNNHKCPYHTIHPSKSYQEAYL